MRVDEIMTEDVATVEATATIGDALEVLSTLDIRHLPVLDGGELVGMISDRDMRDHGVSMVADASDIDRLRALQLQPVSDVMSTDLLTVEATADMTDVINLMAAEKVGALPVVDQRDGSLVGIITYVDVLRAAAELL